MHNVQVLYEMRLVDDGRDGAECEGFGSCRCKLQAARPKVWFPGLTGELRCGI